jgi:hypothetical protein
MTPRDLERAREIVSLYVKEAFWPDYETLTTAIAAAIADEREANAKACDDCYQCGCASAIRARGGA